MHCDSMKAVLALGLYSVKTWRNTKTVKKRQHEFHVTLKRTFPFIAVKHAAKHKEAGLSFLVLVWCNACDKSIGRMLQFQGLMSIGRATMPINHLKCSCGIDDRSVILAGSDQPEYARADAGITVFSDGDLTKIEETIL